MIVDFQNLRPVATCHESAIILLIPNTIQRHEKVLVQPVQGEHAWDAAVAQTGLVKHVEIRKVEAALRLHADERIGRW